jgi:hypothetical protein
MLDRRVKLIHKLLETKNLQKDEFCKLKKKFEFI